MYECQVSALIFGGPNSPQFKSLEIPNIEHVELWGSKFVECSVKSFFSALMMKEHLYMTNRFKTWGNPNPTHDIVMILRIWSSKIVKFSA